MVLETRELYVMSTCETEQYVSASFDELLKIKPLKRNCKGYSTKGF